MSNKPVTAIVPTYRDLDLLKRTLPPLAESPDVEIVIVNNDPSQDVQSWVDAHLPTARVIEMGFDAGYSHAANTAIAASRGEFVLLLDSDVFLPTSYIAEMLEFFTNHPEAGCAGGKLLRYDLVADRPTRLLDSAGTRLNRSRRVMTRGEGEYDIGQYDRVEQVFGVDGSGMMARRSALNGILVEGEYLDSSFFMHKEDADLCWRLRLAGWEIWYVPRAVGAHGRTTQGLGERDYLTSLAAFHTNERRKQPAVRLHAMKNQWLMLTKNEDAHNFVRDFRFIAGREFMVLLYNLFFAPKALAAVREFARLLPGTIRKRRSIKERQMTEPRQFRTWLVGANASSTDGVVLSLHKKPTTINQSSSELLEDEDRDRAAGLP